MFEKKFVLPSLCIILFAVSGCGGGGESNEEQLSTSIPLSTAVANYVNLTSSRQFTVTGTATNSGTIITFSGSGSYSESTTNGVFLGAAALRKSTATTGTLTGNGITIPIGSSGEIFFSSSYKVLGSKSSEEYCEASSNSQLPSQAKPGDNGSWYTMNCWTDETKIRKSSTSNVSWVIEPESLSSAILKIITNAKDSAGNTTSTTTSTRINKNGNISRLKEEGTSTINGILMSLTFIYI